MESEEVVLSRRPFESCRNTDLKNIFVDHVGFRFVESVLEEYSGPSDEEGEAVDGAECNEVVPWRTRHQVN